MTEHKPVKLLGFASGNYYCKCGECGQTFTGDKRAMQCLPCAANQAAVLLKQYEDKYKAGELVYKKNALPYSARLSNLEALVQKQGEEIKELFKRSFS